MFYIPLLLEADISLLRGKFTGDCKRESPRRRFEPGTVGFLTLANGSKKEVWLVDLSEKGIGFYLSRELERGTPVVMELTGEEGEFITVTGKVAHATKSNNGDWLVGCEFDDPIKPEVLDDLT
jgi:hypothetical protein